MSALLACATLSSEHGGCPIDSAREMIEDMQTQLRSSYETAQLQYNEAVSGMASQLSEAQQTLSDAGDVLAELTDFFAVNPEALSLFNSFQGGKGTWTCLALRPRAFSPSQHVACVHVTSPRPAGVPTRVIARHLGRPRLLPVLRLQL